MFDLLFKTQNWKMEKIMYEKLPKIFRVYMEIASLIMVMFLIVGTLLVTIWLKDFIAIADYFLLAFIIIYIVNGIASIALVWLHLYCKKKNRKIDNR